MPADPTDAATTEPVSLFDYEERAKAVLPQAQYDYIAGGAADELSIGRARAVFDSMLLRSRVLVDVSDVRLSTTVLGHDVAAPIMIAPAGFHDRAHPEAECATARAAAAEGLALIVSVNSSRSLEQVADCADGVFWFQQSLYRDRELTTRLSARAAAAGYSAICLTLDSPPYPPRRERDLRNGYRQQPSPNFIDPAAGAAGPAGAGARRGAPLDQAATAADLCRFVDASPLPVLAKGVMNAADARLCVDSGVRAVVVSNHGARNLDTTPAPIEVLPEIVREVGTQVEVFVDGGVRRGTDVLKALALGARAVLIGRPLFWGLAVDGEAGLRRLISILRDELLVAMALCGQVDVGAVSGDVVALESPLGAYFRTRLDQQR